MNTKIRNVFILPTVLDKCSVLFLTAGLSDCRKTKTVFFCVTNQGSICAIMKVGTSVLLCASAAMLGKMFKTVKVKTPRYFSKKEEFGLLLPKNKTNAQKVRILNNLKMFLQKDGVSLLQ